MAEKLTDLPSAVTLPWAFSTILTPYHQAVPKSTSVAPLIRTTQVDRPQPLRLPQLMPPDPLVLKDPQSLLHSQRVSDE